MTNNKIDINSRMYTLDEVSKMVMVTRRTLYNHINNGKLNAVKIGRQWRVTEENLRDYLEAGTED